MVNVYIFTKMKTELFFILAFLMFKTIKLAKIEIIDENILESKYQNIDYLKAYQISNSIMSYKSNGGSAFGHDLSLAFENEDFFSFWQSAKCQNDSFLNHIQISFSKTVIIDRMIYQAPSLPRIKGSGYPIELRIYIKLRNADGTLSDEDSDFLLIDDIISERTGNKVLFIFDQEIICDQIKLEWVEIEITDPNNVYAFASMIKFFFPENEYINKIIFDIYQPNDYSFLSINPEYNDINIIEEIEEQLIEYLDISENLFYIINRIKNIIKGKLKYEPRREFTTNQNAKINIINQHGDINSYSRNILKMSRGGTNRQPTGIYGFANETITFYVEANDDDPLPSIYFSQYMGLYTNWLSSPINLIKGKNVLKVKNFNISDLGVNIKPGGPIYIENKYISEEQSQNVKVYIEGGTLFPYFRLNDDEIKFKEILNEYILNYNKSTDDYYNIIELLSQSVMITVNATDAYQVYNIQGESPQENLLNWDRVIRILYIFDGIQFEEHQPYYDIKNQYINIHIRYAIPYSKNIGAYATDEHIGIFLPITFYNALVSYEEIGSTLVHEIGHMIDVKPREYPERTNVVLEEYAVQVLYKEKYMRKRYGVIHEEIAPDNIDNSLRYCQTSICEGFFNNAGNYTFPQYIWWDIESFNPGYWGKLNNLYRYNMTILGRGMDSNEEMVFLTNLILGFDTAYYFERFGLAMPYNKPFKNSETSKYYKNKMEEAIKEGKIINKTIYKKYWYADSDQYSHTINNGTGCYKNNNDYDINNIRIIRDNLAGNYITLPPIDCINHLGFEIIENETVIGFTTKFYYIDKIKYAEDYNPKYIIRAYDRLLDYIESDYAYCKNN